MELFVTEADGTPLGTIDQYNSLEWKVRFYSQGSVKIVAPQTAKLLSLVKKRRLLSVDSEWYEVEQIQNDTNDQFTILGKTPFPDRICMPPDGQSHDVQTNQPAETALKHFLDNNAGPSASLVRQISNLVILTDQARGESVTYRARFQPLSEVLAILSIDGGIGWKIWLESGNFNFEILEAINKDDQVFFDLEFDSILNQRFISSIMGVKNFAYVAGQGEGELRQIEPVFIAASEPEGWARKELFVDARDTDNEATLVSRGNQRLQDTSVEDVFEVDVNNLGSFKLGEHWSLGDVVKLRSRLWDIERAARVVGIVNRINEETPIRSISVELDKPWPTLRDKVRKESDRPSGSNAA